MNSNQLVRSYIEQPTKGRDPKLEAQSGFANSPWIIVVGIAAALSVMIAVNAWDKRHLR